MFTGRRLLSLSSLPYSHLFRPYSDNSTSKFTQIICQRKINVREMSKKDLQLVVNWAIKESWNPGLYEIDALYEADPKGYHLLEIDDKPVASLAAVRYAPNFAFLGLYIVAPSYRGQGYGKLLWDMVMGNLKDCSTIGLNGVSEQIGQYEKEGFKLAHSNIRWRGNLLDSQKSFFESSEKEISLHKPMSLTSLIDYDARLFQAPRPKFLSKWLTMPQSHVLAAIENGELCGYGVISKANEGYKIAPLVADNQMIAKRIYTALCRCVGKQDQVHIDAPANSEAIHLMEQFGLEKTFETFRMYKGEVIPINNEKWIGLTSLEIG
ncbi:GNAT family N-acetyltransferase [Legionella sp.]|uniref:GNAT family N-acetyltransferase n=1 Tax=Legionella sp. TaxID=459 RepID=UPI003C8B1D86